MDTTDDIDIGTSSETGGDGTPDQTSVAPTEEPQLSDQFEDWKSGAATQITENASKLAIETAERLIRLYTASRHPRERYEKALYSMETDAFPLNNGNVSAKVFCAPAGQLPNAFEACSTIPTEVSNAGGDPSGTESATDISQNMFGSVWGHTAILNIRRSRSGTII
ncbi:hypothetical protein I317_03902 [Kwoniella heveanensis CBS 569]|nr:hypothetical protein I317_03902 [Kwoniella heveanensis CBS 569]